MTTTGVVAYAPKVPVALIGTVQACFRLVTFVALIGLVTSRVLDRLPPGSVHPAAALVVGAGVGADVVADVVADDVVDVVDELDFLLLPPQPDRATLAATTITASDPVSGLLSNVPRISSLSLLTLHASPRARARRSTSGNRDIL
ncbi:MAG: hypothetical protein WAL22_00770 [Solirubrobacteraceae bacterium]